MLFVADLHYALKQFDWLLANAAQYDAVVIGGGAELYDQTLPMCDRLHLTYVHAEPKGDAMFPAFTRGEWLETSREGHPRGPDDEHPFTFLDLKRRI
jgi:dihydrofolate reductase